MLVEMPDRPHRSDRSAGEADVVAGSEAAAGGEDIIAAVDAGNQEGHRGRTDGTARGNRSARRTGGVDVGNGDSLIERAVGQGDRQQNVVGREDAGIVLFDVELEVAVVGAGCKSSSAASETAASTSKPEVDVEAMPVFAATRS